MALKYTNNATSKLASPLSPTDTSLTVISGDGLKYPSLTGSDTFKVTLLKSDGTNEIVLVTARATDLFTIQRAQEGTAAMAFNSGDRVEHRWTAGEINSLVSGTAAAQTTADTALTNAAAAQTTADAAATAAATKVTKTGNETIAGVKTFSSAPVVVTLATHTNTDEAASTKFVNTEILSKAPGSATTASFGLIRTTTNAEAIAGTATDIAVSPAGLIAALNALTFGRSATWQNVSASRALATNFTNSMAYPIQVSVSLQQISASQTNGIVSGLVVAIAKDSSTVDYKFITFTVPPSAIYQVASPGDTLLNWVELR